MSTACGFVRLHEFGWIGDKGNVIVYRLSFFAFCAVSVHIAVSTIKCKQCGCVRRKINNASTTRMY